MSLKGTRQSGRIFIEKLNALVLALLKKGFAWVYVSLCELISFDIFSSVWDTGFIDIILLFFFYYSV